MALVIVSSDKGYIYEGSFQVVILCICENLLANTREIIAISFIKMFKAGPDVSFRGSPTVSPTTAALCN